MTKSHWVVFAKAVLAVILFAALAAYLGSQLAPKIPIHTVLIYTAFGAAALFAVLVCVVALSLMFHQLILRKGGTDTQWLWFSSEPKGLEQLREQAKVTTDTL